LPVEFEYSGGSHLITQPLRLGQVWQVVHPVPLLSGGGWRYPRLRRKFVKVADQALSRAGSFRPSTNALRCGWCEALNRSDSRWRWWPRGTRVARLVAPVWHGYGFFHALAQARRRAMLAVLFQSLEDRPETAPGQRRRIRWPRPACVSLLCV
jgi:hypothetical protein